MQSNINQGNSLFFHALRFPVPLLALEAYAYFSKDADDEEKVIYALTSTLSHSLKIAEPSPEDIRYFVGRLQEIHAEPTADPVRITKSFGTSYAEFLGSESITGLLGLMTHFNIAEMRRLYCEIDFSHAKELMKTFTRHQQERNLIAYEAALYGAGNSYQGDKSGSKGPLDPDSPEGRAMMAQFGVGVVGGLPDSMAPKI